MAVFLMFGKYNSESIKGISDKRTQQTEEIVRNHGGTLVSGYALLGEQDIVLVVDLPGTDEAMAVSLQLHKVTGISFSTMPALTLREFDKVAVKKLVEIS